MRTIVHWVPFALLATPALAAAPPFPPNGSASFSTQAVCRQASGIDMGEIGSDAANECLGIVKAKGASKIFDNMSAKCMERDETRAGKANYLGWCVETDADGDKVFLTYDGDDGGKASFLGGTGKYKAIAGGGTWTVTDAPALVPGQFAFTLDFEMSWAAK